ncbi:MAG: Maf family nucleotide pyrophosphatase [Bacteroidales bacterium]
MFSSRLRDYHFILASRSPRRQQLLADAGFIFDVAPSDVDESYPGHLEGSEIAEYLAVRKAGFFQKETLGPGDIVIAADTVVWCDKKVLDKPSDRDDAFRIIRELSANTHEVITGVCLKSRNNEIVFSEITSVTFNSLSDDEIWYYIDNFKPFDKAGAYGIQEWIGIVANSRIDGSYFNVMGLPVHRLIRELKEFTRE